MWAASGRSHVGILFVHQMALSVLLLCFRAFQIRCQQTNFVNQVL
jgi:hypothetical protein